MTRPASPAASSARRPRRVARLAVTATVVALGGVAAADTITKEQCLDAHSRGQDARDQGKISLARKLFLSCAQSACPPLVQGDCARFADDLGRLQSSLTFVARDAQGNDLPDTSVYLDDALLVTRLDDGRPHDVDPGKHTVRFSSGGKDQTVTVVVGTGEKGRSVVATFSAINPAAPAARGPAAGAARAEPRTTHPTGATALVIGGGAAAAIGAALLVYGVHQVPAVCSISDAHCKAQPGDPVFGDASSAMQLADVGMVVGAAGVLAVAGGLYWYYTGATTERADDKVVSPLLTRDLAGIAVRGRF